MSGSAGARAPLERVDGLIWSGDPALRPPPFVAPRGLRSGHAQTALIAYVPPPRLGEGERLAIPIDGPPGAAIGGRLHRATASSRACVIIVHGIGGTGDDAFVVRTARLALARGLDALRLSMRGGGASEDCGVPGLFHAGLTDDLRRAVGIASERYERVHLVGFSLGGQITLRALGEWGSAAPASVRSIVAVSPPIDLAVGADYAEGLQATPYRKYIVAELTRRYRRACAQMGPRFPVDRVDWVRTIRDYDDAVVAPWFGFASSADYYARVQSKTVLDRIVAPTLIVHADDDPIVPAAPAHELARRGLPNVSVAITLDGGHVGHFAARPAPGDRTRFWAEERAIAWMKRHDGDG